MGGGTSPVKRGKLSEAGTRTDRQKFAIIFTIIPVNHSA